MRDLKYTLETSAYESCGRFDEAFETSLTFNVPYSPDGPTVEIHIDDIECLSREFYDRKHNRASGSPLSREEKQFWAAVFADILRDEKQGNVRFDLVRKCEEDLEASRDTEDTDRAWKDKGLDGRGAA